MRPGHQHFFDVIDRIPVDRIDHDSWFRRNRVIRRTIRIRQCRCGEVGYEVPVTEPYKAEQVRGRDDV